MNEARGNGARGSGPRGSGASAGPGRGSWLRLSGVLAVGAVLLGALLWILLFDPGSGDPVRDDPVKGEAKSSVGNGSRDTESVYVPVGYVDETERLIRGGRLVYDCRSEEIRVEGLAPAEQTFYRNSYLEDDVAAWNRGDRRPFLVEREERRDGSCEGRLTGVNANHHKQRLPTYVANTWRGSLFLRPAAGSTVLTSAQRSLEVVAVPWSLLPLPVRAFEDVWFRPGAAGIRSQRLALKMLERGRAFATLKNVGDPTVLEVLGERPALSLDGCPVPLGWRVRLDDGDVLHAREEGRLDERYLVETGQRAGLVSFLTRVDGEPRRKSYPDRLAMAREVAWAVDAVVDGARDDVPTAVRDDFDVHLTLDPFLGHRLSRELSGFCRESYDRRPLRAAITVLEPSSGRVLAMASYPTAMDLEELGLEEASTRRELLRRNHNFLQHPVGSAGKPFLAAAVLAAEPRLASLQVRCFIGTPSSPDTPGSGLPESLLGYDMGPYNLPPDCQGADDDGWIDLESFLTVSSNRYMLYLGLLAMADWEGGAPQPVRGAEPLDPGEGYRIGGRSLGFQPRIPAIRDEVPDDGLTELQEVLEQTSFPRQLAEIFDQRVGYRREPLVEGLDLELWEPVIRAAYGRTPGEAAPPTPGSAVAFSPITPEAVNLRMNLVQQLRQDLYTRLLGNGENRWSNVQLAEALARLVTGRRVQARLVERVEVPAERSPTGAREVLWELGDHRIDGQRIDGSIEGSGSIEGREPEPLRGDLQERLRQRLLEGLRGVVERGVGTARDVGAVLDRINERAPPGVRYSALAKTGTPTLPRRVVERSPTTFGPEALEVYSGNPQVKSGVLVLALAREREHGRGGAAEREELVVTFFVEAQGGSEEAVDLAARVLPPLVEAYWPEDWLETSR